MTTDVIRAIADAVLYEGYILWPYRRSAIKNRQRWTFGGVYPRAHSEGRDDDPWWMQTQCLLEAEEDERVEVRVRFLHVVDRRVGRETGKGLEFVDQLTVGDDRHLSWEEAVEREVVATGLRLGDLGSTHRVAIDVPGGSTVEELAEPGGERAGAVVWSWRQLAGAVETRAEALRPGLFRLTVRVVNTSPWKGTSREEALKQTFASTHTALLAPEGAFVSLTDPPDDLRPVAEACENVGTWPVLVGDRGDRHLLLSSPIILPDYPEIAPESPGDLFDGTEIDQMLILNVLSLTDEEKREMRDSDPKARAILERTESLSEEELMGLHGAIRDFQAVRSP